ncbi:MAG: CapA family protein [Chitinophagaceae bacterium]|nr:CapA family protein [Chitinophagaceae bacterium]
MIYTSLFTLFSCLFFSCNSLPNTHSNIGPIQTEVNQGKTKTAKKDMISIAAVGDMMLGTNFPDASTLPPNADSLLWPADSLLRNPAITFGNLEGVFLNQGGQSKGSGPNVYNFRQPEAYGAILKKYGFDFLSIANNHANDFGAIGIEQTSKVLEMNGLKFAGNTKNPYAIIERDGLKIGLVAFAPHTGCLDFNDSMAVVSLIKEVKSRCDILIASFHAGAEGSKATHVTRSQELFYNQNRGNVYATTHAMIDAGADVVIGHGPHVPRALELYKNRIIAYSLGNFCTYAKFNLKGINGYAPLFTLQVKADGSFMQGKITSFLQLGEGGPTYDENHSAAKLIKQLSAEDFPESPLLIDEQGNVSIGKR